MIGRTRPGDWLLGFGITGGLLALTLAGWLDRVEGSARNLTANWVTGAEASPGVVAITLPGDAAAVIDDDSERDFLARLHRAASDAEPAAIGYALPLEQPEHRPARRILEALLEDHGDGIDAASRELFQRALYALDSDERLAAAFAEGPPVVLAARSRPATRGGGRGPATAGGSDAPVRLVLPVTAAPPGLRLPPLLWPGETAVNGRVRPPLALLAEPADLALAGVAANAPGAGRDGVALAWRHGDDWLPALPARLRARAAGDGELAVHPGRGMAFTGELLATGPHLRVYPRRISDRADVVTVNAEAVLAGEVDRAALAGQILLVGRAAGTADDAWLDGMPAVTDLAGETAALMAGDLLHLPEWSVRTRLAAFAGIALYLAFLLPRLGLAGGVAVTGLLAVVLLNAQILAGVLQAVWLPLAVPLAALISGHAVHGGVRRVRAMVTGFQAELTAANVRLGEALRAEGRLDEALRRLRHCSPDDDVVECLYGLGLDFERRRRFGEAVEAFAWIERHRPGHRDCERRIRSNRQLQEQAALGLTTSRAGTQTQLLTDGEVQKPMLGRYEIEREIGKGAMGVVYLGRDPRLGRTVAIKTLALDREFEGQSLDEVKGRFLREAETAGRLKHPNIVVVHDVGEEDGVAWMAMDYLEGTAMSAFASEDALLPPGEVFDVLAQVADALDHAHREGVVHRDVKPENILYDRPRGAATVTDFGVARVSDHHRTRTGTILGTPSYMSPEQVAGERVDGRSDIFSAGVTLYQLLTGVLPFTGDSLSNLMYRIANERQRELRRLRPDLPTCATTITNRALTKAPDRRYASAAQFARALRRCGGKLA